MLVIQMFTKIGVGRKLMGARYSISFRPTRVNSSAAHEVLEGAAAGQFGVGQLNAGILQILEENHIVDVVVRVNVAETDLLGDLNA